MSKSADKTDDVICQHVRLPEEQKRVRPGKQAFHCFKRFFVQNNNIVQRKAPLMKLPLFKAAKSSKQYF